MVFIMQTEFSTSLELNVIDYFCTFEYLLSYINVAFPTDSGQCYCPFHSEHTTSPDAIFYNILHQQYLHCNVDNKDYRPHHLLTLNIVPFTVKHVFSAIWSCLSEEEKNIFANDLQYVHVAQDLSACYTDYKKCKISYFELLSMLKNS